MKKVLSLLLLAVLVVSMIAGCAPAAPVNTGSKTVTVEVVTNDGTNPIKITTEEEFLGRALVQDGLVEDNQSDFGLFIITVDGITADESKQEWWCITKGGEELMTGADDTPIADGDVFELTLTTGY